MGTTARAAHGTALSAVRRKTARRAMPLPAPAAREPPPRQLFPALPIMLPPPAPTPLDVLRQQFAQSDDRTPVQVVIGPKDTLALSTTGDQECARLWASIVLPSEPVWLLSVVPVCRRHWHNARGRLNGALRMARADDARPRYGPQLPTLTHVGCPTQPVRLILRDYRVGATTIIFEDASGALFSAREVVYGEGYDPCVAAWVAKAKADGLPMLDLRPRPYEPLAYPLRAAAEEHG